ncbi:lipopolysaccharide biosynthesis protein [Glacieibacterium sp.]|uniref:lipopolysaccharide biosynthesis protein n=1 Tax=Glacieibacterium sp. TaxID=2860237 RepID=UPI003AFFCE72
MPSQQVAMTGTLRALIGTVGHMLSGNAASALVGLAATALSARALGPVDYGVLALTLGYTRAVERLVTFQSWQPLIKYGAALTGIGDKTDLRALLKFGLVLDLAGAGLAWLVAIAIALVAGQQLGWSDQTRQVVLIYCCVLPFNLNGMTTAVLRLFGRFRLAAYGPVGGGLVRLALCAVALEAGAGLVTFTAIWMATQIAGALFSLLLAFRVLRDNGVHGVLAAPLAGVTRRFEGLWSFAWSSNLSLTLRSSANQFDILIVGALAGPAAAGLYNIAKRVGRLAEQVATQVQAVLYPDIARAWSAGRVADVRRTVWQAEWLLFGTGALGVLFFLVGGETLLRRLAGDAFAGAAPLVIVQMVAVTLAMTGTGARSALLAMGRQRQVLLATLAGTLGFHLTALLLIPRIGAMGANIAHIVLAVIASAWMITSFRSASRLPNPEAA